VNRNHSDDYYKNLNMRITTKRSKRYLEAGLLEEINEDFLEGVQSYWKKHYGKTIDPSIHQAFLNLMGKKELKLIPGDIMNKELIRYFNDSNMGVTYRDNNLYDIQLNLPNSVESVVRRIRGNYFDSRYTQIKREIALEKLIHTENEYIIKPSDSNNGLHINKLIVENGKITLNDVDISILQLEEMYGYNFIIQKVIKQHDIMATPHPQSVNTLRMVTLRWKEEIKYLLTFARFGSNGSVKDNAGAGGVCLGVSNEGEFLNLAIDENCKAHTHHPSTNFHFEKMDKIPNFHTFIQYVIDAHKQILHHDFISWDIAVGEDLQPIFLEANFAGATWLYQMATQQPMFGDLTEEVLREVSEKRKSKEKRDVRVESKSMKKLNRNNKKMKKRIAKLKKEIARLESNDN